MAKLVRLARINNTVAKNKIFYQKINHFNLPKIKDPENSVVVL